MWYPRLNSVIVLILVITGLIPASGWARQEEGNETQPIVIKADEWISTGPAKVLLPAFCDEETADRGAELLDMGWLDKTTLRPSAGDATSWPFHETPLEWGIKSTVDTNLVLAEKSDEGDSQAYAAYAAVYIEVFRRQSLSVKVSGNQPFELFLDGESKKCVDKTEPAAEALSEKTATLDLKRGKYCLLVKTVCLPGHMKHGWQLGLEITPPEETEARDLPIVSTSPVQYFTALEDTQQLTNAGQMALSPDGKHLALRISRTKPHRESRMEILDTATGKREHLLKRGSSIHSPKWSPDGRYLAFRSGSSIFTFDPKTLEQKEVLRKQKGLGSYFWAPDSSRLYFMVTDSAPDKGDYERLWDPRDRLTDWNTRTSLHMILADGTGKTCLTTKGEFALTQASVSRDGSRLALVIRRTIEERPYFETEFWLMDTTTHVTEQITKARFCFENGAANLTWSPDNTKIAFTAPPEETPLPGKGKETNAFDTCLWVLDLESKTMQNLSKRFDATVSGSLWWRAKDSRIYFVAQKKAYQWLTRINPEKGGLEFLHDSPTSVSSFAPAKDSADWFLTGSTLDYPSQVYRINVETLLAGVFMDPNKELMQRFKRADWERFNFTNPDGNEIDGWIFYPPRFDPSLKWPMVVYFYGGVSPEEERFSIMYYQWLAAHGYVLYVVNPSGAVGYGRDFANLHCNDWGKLAGRDIILGTKEVLADKPFVDPERIGAYGGSYGGFMTLSLVTQTDLFKASCSMYGISNLTSYWGAGIWGYTYGDTAMAGSYPWANKDLFVDCSPIFSADKVESALLLLHGVDDGNVPSIESEQMFTALKVLGKDVAYVRFAGEDHGIGGKFSNLVAHRNMILEWFDKHLKDDPAGWDLRWKK